MLGTDPRAAKATWTVFLVILAIAVAWFARTAILVFIVALLLAYLLEPLVLALRRMLPPRTPRIVPILLVYVIGAGLLITAGLIIGTRITAEAASLASKVPDWLSHRDQILDLWLPSILRPYHDQIREAINAQIETGSEVLLPALTYVSRGLLNHLSGLLYVILIPILAFLFQVSNRDLQADTVAFFRDPAWRFRARGIVSDIHDLLGQYMRAVFLLALSTFSVYTVFFLCAGMPYALLLAGASGLLEFIPVVGPLGGMLLGVAVGAFSGYDHIGLLIIFFALYRLFQDYVLAPWLYSAGVELHPLLVLFGVLAGEEIGGVAGMFLSVPVLAILRILYRHTNSEAAPVSPLNE